MDDCNSTRSTVRDSCNTGMSASVRAKYVPPHVKLYRARHKVRAKDLHQDPVVRVEVIDIDTTQLLSYNVPYVDDKRGTMFSHCSSIFSLQSGSSAETSSTSTGGDACAFGVKGDQFVMDPELLSRLERDISMESMGASLDDSDYAEFIRTSTKNSGRLMDLPPRSPEEDNKHKQEIAALRSRIRRSEARRLSQLEADKKNVLKRFEFVNKQWNQLMTLNRDVWLIEIRKRDLQWDGIPWRFKQDIYNLCLWGVPFDKSMLQLESMKLLHESMEVLFFEKTDQIVANLYRKSSWCQGTRPQTLFFLLEKLLAHQFPSLYIHLTETLKIDLWHDFLLQLPLYALANSIRNIPRDFPTYEERLLCLFDGLIISAYYNECDKAFSDFTNHIIKNNHYKFFGSKQEVEQQVKSVQLNIHGILESLTTASNSASMSPSSSLSSFSSR